MDTIQLAVRAIIKTVGNHSQVVVSNEVFKAVAGVRPALPYTTARNAAGNGVRIFDFAGTHLYTRRDKELGKTFFIMKKEDAEKCLRTLEQERAGEEVLDFGEFAEAKPAEVA